VACPSSPAMRQPRRLLVDPRQMGAVVASRLSLDDDDDPIRCDRHRVNVSPTLPRQRAPQPPPLRLESGEHAPHLVLRTGADPTPTSEREPVARPQAERSGADEQAESDETRPHAGGPQAKQRGGGGPDPGLAGAREPALLLASRVVHAATASSSHRGPSALSLGWLNHCPILPPAPDRPVASGTGPSYDLLGCPLS
jgi:hypothetical protein